MSDLGRDGSGAIDEDRLPWLEPVDDVDAAQGGVAVGKLIGAVIAALVAIGLIIGGSFWLRQKNVEVAEGGEPATIPAPEGTYKVKPAEPGGMKVAGQGDASYSASAGADPNAAIDTSAMPEAPITAAKPTPIAPKPAPAPAAKATLPTTTAKLPTEVAAAPKPAPAAPKPAPAAPKPAPAASVAGGTQIQLGSFSSDAKAQAAWKTLTGRFTYLAPLQLVVANGEVGGKPVYRLRAVAGAQANGICGKLKVAGETCIIAQH